MSEIKAILIGEAGTGKTNLIKGMMGLGFNENEQTSTTPTNNQKVFKINNKEITINLWDTAGQEKFRSVTKIFMKDAKIVCLVYCIDSRRSFEQLDFWLEETRNTLGNEIVIGIIGNKSDLFEEEEVTEDEGKEYAQKIGAKFKLVSAKESPELFIQFIQELLTDYTSGRVEEDWEFVDKFKLEEDFDRNTSHSQKKKNCGCK